MYFVAGAACLVAVIVTLGVTGLPEQQFPMDDPITNVDEDHLGFRGRESVCKVDKLCSYFGGFCVTDKASCNGRIVSKGCKGEDCKCCIPGCPEGFFQFNPSNQCFKFIDDRSLTWNQANATCNDQGLVLAKPFEPVSLRAYLIVRYGLEWYTWIDAIGNGNQMIWQRDGTQINNESPLWAPGQPGGQTTDDCLELLTATKWWNMNAASPFFTVNCYVPRYALCELIME